jgi:adenosylmethionine-8-amino-7-oxononanoate aminotransferase
VLRIPHFLTPRKELKRYTYAVGHYIDGMFDVQAGAGCNVYGYSNPHIQQAINNKSGFSNANHWTLDHDIWYELGDQLDLITDHRYDNYITGLTGSDAVDNMVKLAWLTTGKDTILVRKNSFHSSSISGWMLNYKFNKGGQYPAVKFVEFFDDLELTIQKVGADNIAAVLVDTVPWVNGLKVNTQEYWANFQRTIEKYNLLLCVDEVMTGIGRMGCWLHSHSLGLKPNMVALGKALTSGHENLSVTVVDKRVGDKIGDEWLPIGNSRSTNVLGAVASVETLRYTIQYGYLDRINEIVIPYVEELGAMLEGSTAVGTVLGYPDVDGSIHRLFTEKNLYYNSGYGIMSYYDITLHEMDMMRSIICTHVKN